MYELVVCRRRISVTVTRCQQGRVEQNTKRSVGARLPAHYDLTTVTHLCQYCRRQLASYTLSLVMNRRVMHLGHWDSVTVT